MRKTLTLLVASTTLTAAIGLTAWSAVRSPAIAADRPIAAVLDDGQEALPLILASDDDDDDDEGEHRRPGHGRGDDDDDDDDDHDDDGSGGRAARTPASVDTVTPPQNGLFGNGAPPQVRVN
ncbi:hypothetical protein V5F77_06375 [Xanthobacter sp. DSM 24535]|uniref:hypothetical protein n=1 Tax=Roseixanthobacter psychrophilus TaxID=3119917 RepID=UPI0037292ADA